MRRSTLLSLESPWIRSQKMDEDLWSNCGWRQKNKSEDIGLFFVDQYGGCRTICKWPDVCWSDEDKKSMMDQLAHKHKTLMRKWQETLNKNKKFFTERKQSQRLLHKAYSSFGLERMVQVHGLVVVENAGNGIEQTSIVGLCANTVVAFSYTLAGKTSKYLRSLAFMQSIWRTLL